MLMNELSIIVRQMRVFSERKLQEKHLGFPEQLVLMNLSRKEKLNQDQLAKNLEIDKGAIAKTLGKLEEKGLILRIANPENKREKLLSLTEKAQETLAEMNHILKEWNASVYRGFRSEEIADFERLIQQVAQNSNDLLREKGKEVEKNDRRK